MSNIVGGGGPRDRIQVSMREFHKHILRLGSSRVFIYKKKTCVANRNKARVVLIEPCTHNWHNEE